MKKVTILKSGLASAFLLVLFIILQLLWPSVLSLDIKWIAVSLLPLIIGLFHNGLIKNVKAFGIELEVNPSQRNLSSESDEKLGAVEIGQNKKLPADYIFINHTSFLREDKQLEFQEITSVKNVPHYDIRVIIDSYYKGAIERIKYVQYYLHRSYPEPIQIRSRLEDKFCLKEIANGEYVLIAKVFFKDLEQPLILERYITLWISGPVIDK